VFLISRAIRVYIYSLKHTSLGIDIPK